MNPGTDPTTFFVTGGTLRPDAPSYVERQADLDLLNGLASGEFCYVLTSRQMGKSSLMVRTAQKLRARGRTVLVLDLTAIGQNLTAEQWYDGVSLRIGRQLDLEDELQEYWDTHRHLGPCQRLFTALHDVVLSALPAGSEPAGEACPGRLVIFVDELDVVRSLPFSTDEFFAAIRECYNRRTEDAEFDRLTFCLLGVATPGDLIRDTRITPFNIGRRIEIDDLTRDEISQFAAGLSAACLLQPAPAAGAPPPPGAAPSPPVLSGAPIPTANTLRILDRVHHWTHGHPYLTQRLCRAVLDAILGEFKTVDSDQPMPLPSRPEALVDALCRELFFSHRARERDDNLMFVRERLLRSNVDQSALLERYGRVLRGSEVLDDEMDPVCNALRLSGLVRIRHGRFILRNRIYQRVFDRRWIEQNTPAQELQRQKGAFRRGVRRGLVIVGVIVLANALINVTVQSLLPQRRESEAVRTFGQSYREIGSYRDEFEVELELDYLTLRALRHAAGNYSWRGSNDVRMTFVTGANPRLEILANARDNRVLNSIPSLSRFTSVEAAAAPNLLVPDLARPLGPLALQAFTRSFLPGGDLTLESRRKVNIERLGRDELGGIPVFVFSWGIDPAALFGPVLGTNVVVTPKQPVTLKAWVEQDRGFVRQIEMDLTPWAPLLVEDQADLQLNRLTLRERRKRMRVDTPGPNEPARFEPSHRLTEVRKLDIARDPGFSSVLAREQIEPSIPDRLPVGLPGLIDLTRFYNGALNQRWHPGPDGNDLAALPSGILQINRTPFDVRGLIQVNGRQVQAGGGRFPVKVADIPIGRTCSRLHFLHATSWWANQGRVVGKYVLHYADGEIAQIPLTYGVEIANWHETGNREIPARTRLGWRGRNTSGATVRLFHFTQPNPRPDVPLVSMDVESTMSDAAPFLVALTVEPWEAKPAE